MGESKWIVAVTVMLPTLIEIIDTSVANVSLDHIRGSLSAGIDEAGWVLTSYLVSNAIVIPMTGWLARTFGRKRYLLFSIFLFTAASFLCGSSTSLGMLVFFRILQGIGGGALQPLSQAILLESFPPKEHGIAMAIFGIGAMFGPIAGPIMGGYITDTMSWRWIFYVNIPIGLLAVFMVTLFIHDPHYLKRTEKVKVDTWGIALLTVGIGALQIVLDKGQREDWFQSDFILVLTAVSVLALALFVIVELYYAEHPIVDLRAFRNVSFSTGNMVMFIAFFNLFGSIVLLPLYAQILLGYTATLAGLVLSPGGVATLIVMPIVGKLIAKRNPKYLLTFGIAAFLFIPLTTLTLSSIPRPQMGNATSIYNLLRNLGGSFGVAFATTMFVRRAQVHQNHLTERLTWLDRTFQPAVEWGKGLVMGRGIPEFAAETTVLRRIYGQAIRQATALGFNDAFFFLAVMMACVLPLVLLIRRPAHQENPPPAGH
ncbi:MAG: DHA2 family efflux MFS transporter permease subunit [Deltaproteobacteria bacterium]|nr:DHA2 family efflux MFS transporter permease subunit [Deltaproteobacteria bacterium]